MYTVKRLPSHASLELLTVTLHCGNYRSCLSLFYRPPSSPADILYSLHRYFESINIPQFSSFVLIGDFNINLLTLLTLPLVIFVIDILQANGSYRIHKSCCSIRSQGAAEVYNLSVYPACTKHDFTACLN